MPRTSAPPTPRTLRLCPNGHVLKFRPCKERGLRSATGQRTNGVFLCRILGSHRRQSRPQHLPAPCNPRPRIQADPRTHTLMNVRSAIGTWTYESLFATYRFSYSSHSAQLRVQHPRARRHSVSRILAPPTVFPQNPPYVGYPSARTLTSSLGAATLAFQGAREIGATERTVCKYLTTHYPRCSTTFSWLSAQGIWTVPRPRSTVAGCLWS